MYATCQHTVLGNEHLLIKQLPGRYHRKTLTFEKAEVSPDFLSISLHRHIKQLTHFV